MRTTRTKKSPTPSPAKMTGAGPASETRKGLDGESVAPDLEARVAVPLVTIDVDAVYRTHGLAPKSEAGR
ncbi:MAG: hypothetical protein KBB14_13670 [Thermoanaerobaculia bacterium]|nr:hypothetical protein [Thermoanaerobaculia bacterium]